MKNLNILLWIAFTVILPTSASCPRSARDVRPTLSRPNDVIAERTDPEDQEHLSAVPSTSSECANADPNSGKFRSRTEVDINSGDYRSNQYRADLSVRENVISSPLSKEVRRLGLETPPPVWKPAVPESYVVGDVDYGYAGAVNVGRKLVGFFEIAQAPDDERRTVLAEFMKSLRTQSPARVMNDGYLLIEKMLSRHGLNILDYYQDPSAFRDYRAKLRDAAHAD